MKSKIIITSDGSCTLYLPELNEHYHSTFGAVQESMHIFIKAGLEILEKERIKIFELGFGTGLNALLTFLKSENFKHIEYHCLELYPLEWKKVSRMGFAKFLHITKDQKLIFKKMHNSSWEENIQLSKVFVLKKSKIDILKYKFSGTFDLVYFDAFAPMVQPELWTEDVFSKFYNAMNKNAVLLTYCAKGEVRRNMQKSGFKVERLPGPPGKREILRAVKA